MEKTDPASSEDVKRMVQDLGSTIQRTLAESPADRPLPEPHQGRGLRGLPGAGGHHRLQPRRAAARREVSTFDFKVEKSEPVPQMTPLDKKFLGP